MKKILLFACVLGFLTSCIEPSNPSVKMKKQMDRSEKRGVAFSFTRSDDLSLLCPYISWDYNWGNDATSEAADWFTVYGIEFCPMCWSGSYSADRIRNWVKAHPETKYLLAFNEPNLTDQANMTPSKAAEFWPDFLALAKELKLKIVAPAMNYGTLAGYNDPIKWMDEFLAQPGVSIDQIYAFSLHCYMKSPAGVKGFIERFQKYNKPIWLTEFCAWDGGVSSVSVQMDYMCNMLNYLEQEPSIERYAWFIPRYKTPNTEPYMQLLTNAPDIQLTELGVMYTHFSTFDKSCSLLADRYIYAGEYVSTSTMNVLLRQCKDEVVGEDGLMITSLSGGTEVQYQVTATTESAGLEFRYTSYSNSILRVKVDKEETFLDLPRTGGLNTWQAASIDKKIPAGQHTITIELMDGTCYLSGFQFK